MGTVPSVDAKRVTSTSSYEVGLVVTYKNNDTSHKNTTVTITPYLKCTQAVKRMQHHWDVLFAIDSRWQATDKYNSTGANALPNDTAAPGVVAAGYLQMKANVWYQWGSARSFNIANDGKTHNFGVYLRCTETVPKYCPAKDTYVTTSKTLAEYGVIPTAATIVNTVFNEDTREVTYTWKPNANTTYVNVWYNLFDESGKQLDEGWVKQNVPTTTTYLVQSIPETINGVPVYSGDWCVQSYSSTGDSVVSSYGTYNASSFTKVWIKVNGVWKKAALWIKVDGVWKKCKKIYTKVNGTWERTIT